ncbi:MAG TPA: glycosyltransferase family 2 protein [Candidatus Aminicenantes bacterium]|nr:glycosyltransferase family 2 protein [Candidatus Aminicenantes bacterium]HRY66100.1 glycosyltransferase family 2 protein [Candidatus Aminicenantes bacterium]HRZ73014.1 glycosyltransferase family 2 protein [Candidatus Aminicenantes bacterium]
MNEPTPGFSSGAVRLSVVIPTYNAESRIAATLEGVRAYLAGKPFAAEIVVVDDGSADGTAAAARAALASSPGAKVLRRDRNLGKGASVREGVLAAAGELVVFSDDDLSTPIGELDKALAALEAGADVVIGSRAHPDSEIRVRQRRPREWLGRIFNLLVRLLVLPGYRDTQCGFKAFRRAAARDVFSRLRTAGFGFDVEVLALCRERGYLVVEIPVVWCDVRPSRVRIFGGSWGMLRDLWRIRRLRRRP